MLGLFEQWMRRRNLSPRTREHRTRVVGYLDSHLAARDLLDAEAADIEACLDAHHLDDASRYNYIRSLNAFYTFCVREGYLLTNPVDRVVRPKLPARIPRAPSDDQVIDAYRQAEGRLKGLYVLAAFAGLRVSEISNLPVSGVDMSNGELFVTGKGNKDRIVPMHDEVRRVLTGLGLPRSGRVFRSQRGESLASNTISVYLGRHLRDCGVVSASGTSARAHDLRHWFATKFYEASGSDIRLTMEVMGHSSPATTAHYTLPSRSRAKVVMGLVGSDGSAPRRCPRCGK